MWCCMFSFFFNSLNIRLLYLLTEMGLLNFFEICKIVQSIKLCLLRSSSFFIVIYSVQWIILLCSTLYKCSSTATKFKIFVTECKMSVLVQFIVIELWKWLLVRLFSRAFFFQIESTRTVKNEQFLLLVFGSNLKSSLKHENFTSIITNKSKSVLSYGWRKKKVLPFLWKYRKASNPLSL